MPKTIAITGGTRGIGYAVADLFYKKGCHVAVCSRTERESHLPREFLHVQTDVRRREEQELFVRRVLETFHSLDVFVNCAGVSRWKSIEDMDEAFVAEVIETNLLGTLWGCSVASKVLGKDSVILNVSSLAGKRGSANNSAYCASKFAVNGITQSLAKELGPRGIRVNAVCPVYVATGALLLSLEEKVSPAQGQEVADYLATFAKTQTALGRLPTEEEVAEVIYFLSSPQASGITGQCINVDCGTFPQ